MGTSNFVLELEQGAGQGYTKTSEVVSYDKWEEYIIALI